MSDIAPEIEALLLQATEPVPATELAEVLAVTAGEVEAALSGLADFYTATGRGFELRQVAGGWRYYTRPEHSDVVARWVLEGQSGKLSQAALETLSVIAYLQPISRGRVSAVRGVNVDGVVRTLIARGLLAESGRDESGAASQLRTTPYFLERMGLGSLDDLPPLAPHLPEAADLEAELVRLASPAAAVDPEGDNSDE